MIIRLWRARVDPARREERVRFEREHSLPMFRSLPGCLGVQFLHRGDAWAALSLWTGPEAIERATALPLYRDTVRRLEQTGLVLGEPAVEVYEATGGFFDMEALAGE